MHAASGGPPQLYSWTVIDRAGDPPQLGALGVSDNPQRALARLSDALRDSPASEYGVVHKVTVSQAEVGYWYGEVIVRAELDEATGAVVHRDVEPPGERVRLNAVFGGPS